MVKNQISCLWNSSLHFSLLLPFSRHMHDRWRRFWRGWSNLCIWSSWCFLMRRCLMNLLRSGLLLIVSYHSTPKVSPSRKRYRMPSYANPSLSMIWKCSISCKIGILFHSIFGPTDLGGFIKTVLTVPIMQNYMFMDIFRLLCKLYRWLKGTELSCNGNE